MNPIDYLDPSDSLPISGGVSKNASTLVNTIPYNYGKPFPVVKPGDIVIVGAPESRNSSNQGSSKSPDLVRSYFFSLSSFALKIRIIDAGNLKPTKTPSDSYSAIKDLADYFLSKKATLIILGGTQEISFAVYQAIREHRKSIGVTMVDSRLDFGSNDGDFCSTAYFQKFFDEPITNLFNISLVGYQGYLVDSKQIDTITKLHHEALRLGFVRGNLREVEPTFRDSDFVSFDIGAIRHSDCPGNLFPSPNGLYAEEACQLSRFAGLSDKTCCFGIFEHNPELDPTFQGAHLSAQLIWHFIEAFSQRKNEDSNNNADFKKFIVDSTTPGIEMVFYKSMVSDNWWMEIPISNKVLFPSGKMVVACSYNDYVAASKQELPERWIRASLKTY
jgi:arginase family enzyme